MRFTRATHCTTEILADLAQWHSQGMTLGCMRERLEDSRAICVSTHTIGNWLRGKTPKTVELPARGSGRYGNDVPRGTRRNKPLRFSQHTGSHRLRAPFRGGEYSIGHHVGSKGIRYLCWWFPLGVHEFDEQGRRVAGGIPVGLFTMRRNLRRAREDAVHHARTGEIRA